MPDKYFRHFRHVHVTGFEIVKDPTLTPTVPNKIYKIVKIYLYHNYYFIGKRLFKNCHILLCYKLIIELMCPYSVYTSINEMYNKEIREF